MQARLAQSVERKALNLVVVGSSPTVGVLSHAQTASNIRIISTCLALIFNRAHGVVVSRLLRMQKALGSNPSGSTFEIMLHPRKGWHGYP